MTFEARTLCLSRHGRTRGREWWRGFRAGLLLSLAIVVIVVVGAAFAMGLI